MAKMKKTIKWKIDSTRLVLAGFAAMLLVTLILLWLKGDNQRMAISILMLKIIGFGACVLLVLGELHHPFFDKICPKGEKLNCHAVMESPAAKLFCVIPLADIGGIYFSGGIILICFSTIHPHFFYSIFLLALLNLLTLPFTIFSVLYQAFVVKFWCLFCLIVQLIFWLEFWQLYPFLSAGIDGTHLLRFRFDDFYPIIWSFGLPTLIWLLFRPVVKKAIEADKHHQDKK
jgi:uncharacterized membrane protein